MSAADISLYSYARQGVWDADARDFGIIPGMGKVATGIRVRAGRRNKLACCLLAVGVVGSAFALSIDEPYLADSRELADVPGEV